MVRVQPGAQNKNTQTRDFILCAEQARLLACVVGLEALLPYLRIILIMSKWERDTAHVMGEMRSGPTRQFKRPNEAYSSSRLNLDGIKSSHGKVRPCRRHRFENRLQSGGDFLLYCARRRPTGRVWLKFE